MNANSKAWFPALLKNTDGGVVSEGRASVAEEINAVNFTGEYVPLYRLGTPLEIARVLGERVIQRFWGKVYLSDRRLLRLVSVQSELLPGAEQAYSDALELPARITAIHEEKQSLTDRLFSKKKPSCREYDVVIREMNDEKLVFLHDMQTPFSEGERFWLQTRSPMPSARIGVEVAMALFFGEQASYTCRYFQYEIADMNAVDDFLFTRLVGDRSV